MNRRVAKKLAKMAAEQDKFGGRGLLENPRRKWIAGSRRRIYQDLKKAYKEGRLFLD